MPFKTRSKKVSAGARRYHFNDASISLDSNLIPSYKNDEDSTSSEASHHKIRSSIVSGAIESDYSFVKRDFMKVALAAFFIIGLQLVLRFSPFSK